MYDFGATLLSWLYDLWPSYGGSIILLTLVIMTVMAPVTVRQTRSMMAMQRLAPEIKKMRARHGGDREALNQEMMALYQANGVNPLGGCLPIVVQMPIFLVLFQVVRGLTRRVTDIGLVLGERSFSDSGEIADFADRTFNPDFLNGTSQLARDLRATTEMNSFGLDLSQSASDALGDSILGGMPYLLLVIAVGVTTWVQQKQIQGRQSGADINPQQQMIMKILPFMLPVFSFSFPAALVVYWFVSNLFRVGQQVFITKKVYGTKGDEIEIVMPAAGESKKSTSQTVHKEKARGGASNGHGRRSPVTGPPAKRKKKPTSQAKPAAKKSSPERRERQERTTSKRVTPSKKAKAEPPPKRRRDRKKK